MAQLFYLKECPSTNDEISKFLLYENSDFIALHTFNQTKGRGQYGNTWSSTAEKNVAYTLAVSTHHFTLSDFMFNYYTAIIIRDFLANMTECDVKIKWPNDIILKSKKIVGILIEKKKLIKKIISSLAQDSMFYRRILMKFRTQARFLFLQVRDSALKNLL
ncbi:hypothetical protein MTQ00_17170 [Chryseobacterium sp. B21-037]|uniref:biotin--[acetyl-CoA-carboxylase] ligase n=1 Tax=Chryseobacterium sp. B21-037 TaxID=2926038 RepID=UPI00235835BD|nr:hypothetical protein [Chryseobacterium sp. B21-037]MDC8106254.1 hypothetical protein [Chryseobacterium sp. B21-037]